MKKQITQWTPVLLLLLIILSCGTSPVSKAKETTVEPKAAVAEPAQLEKATEAAQALKASEEIQKTPVESKEYLGEGLILAGLGDRVGGPYTVNFYPAKVLSEPSEATKQEGKVKLRDKDEEHWTPYIAHTRPAEKEELKPGLIVFTGEFHGTNPDTKEDLEKTKTWFIYRVKDLTSLYKDIVTLTMFDGYWNTWKDRECHYLNIRILEGELPLELIEF